MNNIYDRINAKTNGKYAHVRFAMVAFKDGAVITVVCKKSDRAALEANKGELLALIQTECAFNTPITLKIVDDAPTAIVLRNTVVEFTRKFKYVSSITHTITVRTDEKNDGFIVTLKMPEIMFELAKTDYIPRLEEFLRNKYLEQIKLNIERTELTSGGGAESSARSEYAVADVTPVIGDFAPKTARSISSLTDSEYNVAVCGVFVMPTAFTSKSGKRYERFLLYDGQTSLQCRFSPNGGQSIVKPELLNKSVCVLGNVEYDKMRNEATMFMRELSLCGADIKITPSPECPKRYERVTPEQHLEFVQSSMFDNNAERLPDALKGSFVVFDFETTGLSVLYDKPTELGAVKITDGKIIETFSTFIDPKRPIPPVVSEKTGITDDMVKGQPLFEDVIPDFYKFTYGCSLVCHNIAFDFPFLISGGNGAGYAFGDRKTFDTMAIAPSALPGISRLSLDSVLEALGLTNDSAHRAWADALATAKAFIAMHKILDKNIR